MVDILLEWRDSRMTFNSSMTTPIPLSVETDEFFWQPDLWIQDESSGKSAYLIDQYVRLFTNGKIQLIKRLKKILTSIKTILSHAASLLLSRSKFYIAKDKY